MKASAGLSLLFVAAEVAHAFVGHAPLHALSSSWRSASSFTSSPSSSSLEARSWVRSTAKAGWAPGAARTSRIVVTRMGEVAWSKTKIVESSKVAADQHALTIDAGDISKGYEFPGQYVQIRVGDGKPGFFAIASPPSGGDGEGASSMEFLIKATDSTTPLITAKPGDTVEMSPVMGKGFPIKENFSGYKYDFPIQNVVLMASGTGIAPMRAAIESGALELPDEEDNGVFGRSCKLFWGCKDEESMPWQDKMKDWDSRGVEVVPVLSEPSSSWTGRTGYIQGAMKEDGIRLPRNSGVLVCGHQAMGEEVKAIALAAGVLDGRVLSNF